MLFIHGEDLILISEKRIDFMSFWILKDAKQEAENSPYIIIIWRTNSFEIKDFYFSPRIKMATLANKS